MLGGDDPHDSYFVTSGGRRRDTRDPMQFDYAEDFQRDPEPPRNSFRVWLVAGALVLAVVGVMALAG